MTTRTVTWESLCSERTLPSSPLPPTLERATASANSVLLRWRPAYPPTGLVDKYTVKQGEGEEGEQVVWRTSYEVPGNRTCVGEGHRPPYNRSVCWRPSGLRPATQYHFVVNAFNAGVEEASNFSVKVSVRTEEAAEDDPGVVTTGRPHDHPVTPWNVVTEVAVNGGTGKEEEEEEGTDPLIVVLGLSAAVLLMVVLVVVLFYKMKMSKLKQHYEQGGGGGTYYATRDNLDSSIRSPPGRSISTGGGDASFHSTFTDVTLAGSDFFPRWSGQVYRSACKRNKYILEPIIQYIFSLQVNDIQSRRLPEPPPATETSFIRPTSSLIQHEERQRKPRAAARLRGR